MPSSRGSKPQQSTVNSRLATSLHRVKDALRRLGSPHSRPPPYKSIIPSSEDERSLASFLTFIARDPTNHGIFCPGTAELDGAGQLRYDLTNSFVFFKLHGDGTLSQRGRRKSLDPDGVDMMLGTIAAQQRSIESYPTTASNLPKFIYDTLTDILDDFWYEAAHITVPRLCDDERDVRDLIEHPDGSLQIPVDWTFRRLATHRGDSTARLLVDRLPFKSVSARFRPPRPEDEALVAEHEALSLITGVTMSMRLAPERGGLP